MRITIFVLAVAVVISLSTPALAGGTQKVDLTPPAGSPEPAAKGFMKVKYQSGAELFQVKVIRITRGEVYGFFLETGKGTGVFAKFAERTSRGAALKFEANSRRTKGPGMPQGATLAQMAGRLVQVRDSDGQAILEGVVPADSSPDPTPPPDDGPSLRILATDAPFPYGSVKSAVVIVDRIEMRKADGAFETLIEYPNGLELDLVDLKNGIVAVLFSGDPEPAVYDAMRVIVRAKEITVLDGGAEKTFTEFKVPSGPQTGLKLFFDVPVTVVTHLTTDLVLDFDLSKSFIVQGNPSTPAGIKGFHFQPVLRVVNASTAGTLTFLVMSDNGTPGDPSDDFYVNGATYRVLDSSVDPPSTVVSGASGASSAGQDGWVFHPAVPAGTWTLEVSYTGHVAATLPVTLFAANLTDAGIIVLEASTGTISGRVGTTITTIEAEALTIMVDGATVTATADGATEPAGTDTTNTFGEFELTDLPLAPYTVEASKAGYSPDSATSSPDVFGAPTTNEVSLELVALTADVIGTVSDSVGPVEGATVRAVILFGGEEKVIAETTTDANGNYTLAGLATASYAITATKTVSEVTVTDSADLNHLGGGSASTVDLTLQ